MEYNKFPHIFNMIIGYIIDTKEIKDIKEYIRGYNINVYVEIVREKIELHQITKIDIDSKELYTTQSGKHGYIELLKYLYENGCE